MNPMSLLSCLMLLAPFLLLARPAVVAAQKANFSGTWKLDVGKSDKGEERIRLGFAETALDMEGQKVRDRLLTLGRALETIEIKHTEQELQFFDEKDNVRIYYLDGRKHARQTPWRAKLDAVSQWEGDQVVIRTKGKDVGEVDEIYGLEGPQLVYVIRIRPKGMKNEIVVKQYYNRASG